MCCDSGLRIFFTAWESEDRGQQGKADHELHESGVDHALYDDCCRDFVLGVRGADVPSVCAGSG